VFCAWRGTLAASGHPRLEKKRHPGVASFAAMEYHEYPAGARLAPFVDRLWTLSGSGPEMAGATQPVLPDGRSELIIHFGDPFDRGSVDGAFERQSAIIFAGQLTGQLLLRPSGAAAVLGIRFHPFGASSLVDIPQHRVAGATPALEDIDGPLARALAPVRSMTDQPARAIPFVRSVLERAIRPDRLDARVRAAAAAVAGSCGTLPVESLARLAGMSRRHLERRFLDDVGVSPKRLGRITRFQAVLHALQDGEPRARGAATAAQFGYADQAHFIREFRELAGCTPAGHLLQQAALTGFFITGGRAPVT
jgi:AraC-like DNA-binding protein